MKRTIKLINILLILCLMILCATGCSNNEIDQIKISTTTFSTLYKYKIKSMELVVVSTNKVIESTDRCKYYYSTEKYLEEAYKTSINNPSSYYPNNEYLQLDNKIATIWFTEIVRGSNGTYYSKKFDPELKEPLYIRLNIGKLEKTYRPSYKTNGELMTVYYCENIWSAIAAEEVPYKTAEEQTAHLQTLIRNAISDAFKQKYTRELSDLTDGKAAIQQTSVTFPIKNLLTITYAP